MLDHIGLNVSEYDRSRDFYDALWSVLPVNRAWPQPAEAQVCEWVVDFLIWWWHGGSRQREGSTACTRNVDSPLRRGFRQVTSFVAMASLSLSWGRRFRLRLGVRLSASRARSSVLVG
jgi:catechol 2,3-dioxygenase-like lactoylglutathione lyase family enzyme